MEFRKHTKGPRHGGAPPPRTRPRVPARRVPKVFERQETSWRKRPNISEPPRRRTEGGGDRRGRCALTEEAEMRVGIKGVAPPPACLFPSPAAVGSGGEVWALRRPAWSQHFSAALDLCLCVASVAAPLVSLAVPSPPSPPLEIAVNSRVLTPASPAVSLGLPSSGRRLRSSSPVWQSASSLCAPGDPYSPWFPVTPCP